LEDERIISISLISRNGDSSHPCDLANHGQRFADPQRDSTSSKAIVFCEATYSRWIFVQLCWRATVCRQFWHFLKRWPPRWSDEGIEWI